jgi:hypothetical protein
MTTATAVTPETIAALDAFTRAYLECLLWAETDNADESGGEPLDRNYDFYDFDPGSLDKAVEDCRRFQEENAADLALYNHPQWSAAELGGHDFWLTRNGHGAGFWDRTECLPKGARDRLTAAAKKYGEIYVYVGDDGNIYIE